MQVIDRVTASRLLEPLGMKIGGWNDLCALSPVDATYREHTPSSDALELYVAAHRLANWVVSGSWTLLQLDNSTSPAEDEIAIFEKLALKPWDIAEQHTFLLDDQGRQSTLVLLIYFALLFTWHIHLTSEASLGGQRLALLDGVAYFFGPAPAIQSADELIKNAAANPRALVP